MADTLTGARHAPANPANQDPTAIASTTNRT